MTVDIDKNEDQIPQQTAYEEHELDTEDETFTFGTDKLDTTQQEPRCACLLLLDVSTSMGGSPIRELNSGIQAFQQELIADELAALRVEPAIITFGSRVDMVHDFGTADKFVPPVLTANGSTPMGQAIELGIKNIEERKNLYRMHDIEYYRPWIFLITDGEPTDSWQKAARQVHEGEENKKFLFFAVGTKDANFDILRQISSRSPVQLKGAKFRELFTWLSASMRSVSRSRPEEDINLSDLSDWGTVPGR